MYSHTVQQDTVDDGGQTDVTDDIEPLSHGHESEDGDAHANICALGVAHAKGVVVEGREDRNEPKGKHLEDESVHEDGLGLVVFEIVQTHGEESKKLHRHDDGKDGVDTGIE